jgi:EAL domain-containing protein (putative c-di-GMP-specific phosphodiesterase class I)
MFANALLTRGERSPAQERRVDGPSLLDAAIARGGLHPFFQPKVSMATRRIVGAEALARIATPAAPHAGPALFIALAERNHRIDALTIAMARAVAGHVAAFSAGRDALPCSINISPVSLDNPDLPAMLWSALADAGLRPGQFTLEITQGCEASYGPLALATMARLRTRGFGLSVGVFGASYTDLARLNLLPLTEVKLDPGLTRRAMEFADAAEELKTILALASSRGLRVVAEGVETEAMWDFLAGLGVKEAQGFLMSKPLPPPEFARLLQEGHVSWPGAEVPPA